VNTPDPSDPHQEPVADEVIPPPTNPMAVARHLSPAWQYGTLPTLLRWRSTWMRWEDSYWRELEDQELTAWLYKQLEYALYLGTNPKGEEEIKEWAPTIRKVADLVHAIAAITHLPPAIDPPAWIETPQDVLSPRRSSTPDRPAEDHGPVVACGTGSCGWPTGP
jgi:putative DNA primase/helicase